jgi:hypothetical protein
VLWAVWLAWIFDWINNLGEVRQGLAEAHGSQVLAFERSLHLAPELRLNVFVAAHHELTRVVVAWYEGAHGVVTFGVIFWLWWRRADLLGPLRAALIAVNLVGQAVFWTWPVAPPRMLPHPQFTDLVAVVAGQPAHWAPGAVSLYANQLSALPSLHLAWAVWSAVALWRLCGRRRWVRVLICVYPFVTAAAVMATANHYLTDCVTGAALAGVAIVVSDLVYDRLKQA